MPGNMLRMRKRDVNLKPNRVLDKRGSRGMLYENEDLRIRTIHINDEVEKGHNDIKKLKKENEHLKREIWNLRDEYEKLEDMMQRMCATYGNPEDSSPEQQGGENPMTSSAAARKYQLKNYRRESEATTSASMYDSEDEELEDMMMIDEDGKSYDSASVVGLAALAQGSTGDIDQQYGQYACAQAIPEDDSSLDSMEMTTSASKTSLHHHHLWQHLTSVPPDLEMVKEESESNNQSPMPKSGPSPSESPNDSTRHESQSPYQQQQLRNSNFANLPAEQSPPSPGTLSLGNPFFNPKIEITPAGSPTPTSSRTGTGTPPDPAERAGNPPISTSSSNVQNLGCVTLIPKKFQVTSQLRISEGQQPDSARTNQYEEEMEDGNAESPMSSQTGPVAPYHRRFLPNPSRRRGSQSVGWNQTGQTSDQIQTLSFPNSGLSAQPLSSFYQSEPTLSSNNMRTNPEVYLSLEDCERGFDARTPAHSPQSFRSNPNYLPPESPSAFPLERYLVIGYLDSVAHNENQNPSASTNPKPNYYEGRNLKVEEVIDSLENQFGSTLEQIVGVRVMRSSGKSGCGSGQTQILISTSTPEAVSLLVGKGLTLSFETSKTHVNLIDATRNCEVVTLSGVPPSLPDPTIISALNQFGFVIAPVERRSYKGIDISERVARIHLLGGVRLPSIVNIAGYPILAKTSANSCQEPVEWSGSANVVEQTSVNSMRPTPPVIHQTTTPPRLSPLTNSISLDQIPRQVTQRAHSPNPACQDETTRMRLMERPSSPNPSIRSNNNSLSLNGPGQQQLRGAHRLVARSVSSAPRLESGGGLNPTTNPLPPALLAKRRMSTCSEISEENPPHPVHPSPSRASEVGVDGSIGGAPNTKRPLSRLLRSSPGSLVPPDSQFGGAGNKFFHRSMSFDPRRNSNASRCFGQPVIGEPTTIGGFGNTEGGNTSGNRLLQSQMSHQSQLGGRNGMSMGYGNGKNETEKALPWCGCWGNGCI